MGSMITLKTADGTSIGAYKADPQGTPRGAIVVLQEIFGVNSHIRNVTDRYAAQGLPRDRAGPLRPGQTGHRTRV